MVDLGNQVRFTKPTRKTPTVPSLGKAIVGPNTEGTGVEGVPTAIALKGKRTVSIPNKI